MQTTGGMSMKKKILPFILVFIVLIVCNIFIFYVFNNNENDNLTTDIINKENVINDSINTSSDKDVIIETQDEEKQTNHDVDIKEEKTTSEKQETASLSKDKNDISIKEDTSSNIEEEVPPTINENVNKEVIVEDEINNSDVIVENEEIVPDTQEDQELERLKNLIKYKTSQECYEASIDISFQYIDNENFNHTACKSFAYKGELLGYRMLIYYKDGTTEYLDAIG